MSAINIQAGRLGADYQFRVNSFFQNQVFPGDAVAVFFHYGAGKKDGEFVIQIEFLDDSGGGEQGCHSTQLIGSTTSPDLAVFYFSSMRWEVPIIGIAGINRVDMSIESDQPFTVAEATNHTAQSIDTNFVETD